MFPRVALVGFIRSERREVACSGYIVASLYLCLASVLRTVGRITDLFPAPHRNVVIFVQHNAFIACIQISMILSCRQMISSRESVKGAHGHALVSEIVHKHRGCIA